MINIVPSATVALCTCSVRGSVSLGLLLDYLKLNNSIYHCYSFIYLILIYINSRPLLAYPPDFEIFPSELMIRHRKSVEFLVVSQTSLVRKEEEL